MNRGYAMALVALALMVTSQAVAKSIRCPMSAPREWPLTNGRLNAVRVLSFPVTEPPVEGQALPIMAFFEERQYGPVLRQTWNMNFDAPRYKFQVDCLYSATDGSYGLTQRGSNNASRSQPRTNRTARHSHSFADEGIFRAMRR